MTVIIGGLTMVAIALFVWGDHMRHGLPKFDLLLASTAAAPVAMKSVVHPAMDSSAIRFFTAPLLEFDWHGIPTYLTAPDCLALASSFVLVLRFLVWTICPLLSKIAKWRKSK